MLTAVWTVWGILKIIGLVLLGIIGLMLAMILLTLLVPIRYQAQIKYDGAVEGKAGVSWLCHIVSVRAVYQEKLTVFVRIFGIRVFRTEKTLGKNSKNQGGTQEEKTPGAEQENAAVPPNITGTITEESTEEKVKAEPEAGISEKEEEEKGPPVQKDTAGETSKRQKKRTRHHKKQKKKGKTKKNKGFSFRRIYDKLKGKLRRIFEFLAGIKEKEEKLKAFVNDPANQRTYRLLKRQIWKLCKHVFPQKISGRIRFGFDDPYKTGQVLTYLSPFYCLYARDLQIIPVFEEAVLEGGGKLKGRVRIGTVLLIAVRMLFDKNFRVLLKKLLRA